jgi:hypothetical protein
MKPAALRLIATAVLFVGWIGYLAYLAAATRNPIVLSRPQFLISGLDVIATRTSDGSFVVGEVLYPSAKNEEWKGKTIIVQNIDKCQTFTPDGWRTGPLPAGPLLLPLQAAAPGKVDKPDEMPRFEVVPIPASPGFRSDSHQTGPSRIYPDDAAVRSQYRTFQK